MTLKPTRYNSQDKIKEWKKNAEVNEALRVAGESAQRAQIGKPVRK
jgi:hypothetical protein